MKRFLKKMTVGALSIAMMLTLFGCGENPTETPATEPETTEAATESTVEQTEETKLEGKELLKYYANEFISITEGKDLTKYEAAVTAYENETQEKGKIIFFGSSLFTRWTKSYGAERELEEDMASESGEQVCLNHGIGGSNIAHNIYYYKRMVKNYEPKALCLSVLANYVTDYNFTQEQVMLMIEYFLEMARQDFPGIHFYMSMGVNKPAKKQLFDMLEAYAKEHDDVTLVYMNFEERYDADTEGHPGSTNFEKDVYVEDGVHLTPLGYKYYTQMWREALGDELK